jgi:hypothetical protein
LKSEAVFSCYKAVESSQSFQEALTKVNNTLTENGGNSISAELAKRVIPLSFTSSNPSESWRSLFLSEITKYVVSRDASGFVGEKYRNKSVTELVEFKKRIGSLAMNTVSEIKSSIKNFNDWKRFIDTSVSKLKNEQ